MNNTCIIVQARLSSSRIPRKMTKPFAGSTLLDILLKKITSSAVIPSSDVYASVYENELKEIAQKYSCRIFPRSERSANTENDMKLMFEWWDKLPYQNYIIVSACHPFLSLETIESFYSASLARNTAGLFAVATKRNYYWNPQKEMMTKWPVNQTTFNTKAVEVTYEAAHCLYAGKMDDIGMYVYMGDIANREVELFVIENNMECMDIDEPWQFHMCEAYYKCAV